MNITTKDAIEALMERYAACSKGRSLDYIYGFMDALAVLREMDENSTHFALGPVISSH